MDDKEQKKKLKKYEGKPMEEHPEWDAQAEYEFSEEGHNDHAEALKIALKGLLKDKDNAGK